jgi:hypothetical protein
MNAIYIQGSLFENFSNAIQEVYSFSVLLTDFEKHVLPFTAVAVLNVTKPPLFAIYHIMLESGLQQQLKRLETTIASGNVSGPVTNFTSIHQASGNVSGLETHFISIHQALKLLRFDRFQPELQMFSAGDISNQNIFSIVSSEFSKQRIFFEGLYQFSQRSIIAFEWVSPWVVSSWPWLLVVLLSFFQLQSVVIRSNFMFSTIIFSATFLQFVVAFLAFILFSISTVINDLCALLPGNNAEIWQSVTESSFFWTRFGKGCLSEQSRNIFAAFDPNEAVSCDSVLNVSQYSKDVDDILTVCKYIGSVDVSSRLNALEATDPNFVAEFVSIRFEINQSYSLLTTQWPKVLESLEQASKDCTSYLQRCII